MAHPRNPPEARQPPEARKRKPAPAARQPAQPLGFGNLFGQAPGGRQARREVTASRPVDTGQGQIGRQLLNLSATGRFTPERVLKLLSGVPALKKFPVATKQLASAPAPTPAGRHREAPGLLTPNVQVASYYGTICCNVSALHIRCVAAYLPATIPKWTRFAVSA